MKKILFINTEITPYVPETELSTWGKNLPHAMQDKGFEIRTFMPKWGNINERRGQLHEVIRLSGLNIDIKDIDHPTLIKVASIPQTKIQVYFIDNDDFFMKRGMSTDENGNVYTDNGQRAIFFARAVVETLKKLRWTPDIIHCQGWMAAFVPFYLKKAYADEPAVCNAKVVTSLFGQKHISPIKDEDLKECLVFKDITLKSLSDFEQFSELELARLSIENSDALIAATNDIDEATLSIVNAANKPMLEYQEGDFADSYNKFYEKILNE